MNPGPFRHTAEIKAFRLLDEYNQSTEYLAMREAITQALEDAYWAGIMSCSTLEFYKDPNSEE